MVLIFGLIIFLEALSLAAYLYPIINPFVFGIVALTSLALSLKKLEWGIWLIFGELVIGSFGKLFVLQIGGVELSIRVVLWLIVMSVWIARAARTRRVAFLHSQFFKPYLILAVVLVWGAAWGLVRGHDFGAVFFDMNNYFYFALVFPVYEVLSRRDAPHLRGVSTIIMAAVSWLAIKTIILFYIFSHELFGLQDILYAWSRKMQLVEITSIGPTVLASRIFMQSQVWILFGLFITLGYLFFVVSSGAKRSREIPYTSIEPSTRDSSTRRWRSSVGMTLALSVLLLSSLIMSLSRSFWLAGLVSLVLMIGFIAFIFRERFLSILRFSGVTAAVITLGVGLTWGVANFPFPPGKSGGNVIAERATKFSGEAAASSRLSQIRPLLEGITKHPAIGSGFGQAVTYQSQDPRILRSHPDGWYTTTAFELGWLEMWLKIGLVGVGVYLYLLWRILQAIRMTRITSELSEYRYLALGAMVGLFALIITHGFSPYLNHPLGIGIVILLTSYRNN